MKKNALTEIWKLIRKKAYIQAIRQLESNADRHDPEALALLAHIYYLMQDYTSAETYANAALRYHSGNRRALSVLGEIACKKSDWKSAEGYYSEAVRLYPRMVFPAIRAAYIQCRLNQPRKAIDILHRISEFHPDNLEILNALQQSYILAGKQAEAEAVKRKISEISQANDTITPQQFIESLNKLDPHRAIAQLKIALDLESYKGNPTLLSHLASLLIETEQYSEAIPILEDLARQFPRSDSFKLKLAGCLAREKRCRESLDILDAMDHLKNSVQWIIMYLEANILAGNLQTAMDTAVSTLLRYPKNRRVRKIVNQLRKRGVKPSDGLLK